MARAKIITDGDGAFYGIKVLCPGCQIGAHILPVDWTPEGMQRSKHVNGSRPVWGFNGDLERPTLSPSILGRTTWGEERVPLVCHSFVRDGRIEFLADCTHMLAGQTVDLPEIT